MAICISQQLVYEVRREIPRLMWVQLGLALLLLALIATKVWVRLETTQLGYQLARQRQKSVELDFERRELELSRSVLMRHDQIREEARTRLGLVPLKKGQVWKIAY